jgi:L-lysine 6-oxidase
MSDPSKPVFKIFPPIAVARVGNAPEKFYIGPETYRGLPTNPDGTPFTDSDFRDADGALCRQAALFHVYRLDNGAWREVTLATQGVTKITWTAHIANKKSSWYDFLTSLGEDGYAPNHPLRNPMVHGRDRLKLIIDPGPREIAGASAGPIGFNKDNVPPHYKGANFIDGPLQPTGEPIDTLGELRTDAQGRLLLLGGLGVAGSTNADPIIVDYANNNDWWDDTSDGVVRATIEIDGAAYEADPGWVLVGPPAYAPELANLVTLYDTIFDAAVRAGHYPAIFDQGFWNRGRKGYRPNFRTEVAPLLERATLYPWVAAIPPKPHTFDIGLLGKMADVGGEKIGDPGMAGLRKYIFDFVRPPNKENVLIGERGATMMPFLAGDNCLNPGHSIDRYLRLTDTQFFFLEQWVAGWFVDEDPGTSAPDAMLRGVLENCVGGAFSPGIEMSWISRNQLIYSEPFRIKARAPNNGPLDLGFDPQAGMEPGDITRYMAVPWQADFNECSAQPIGDRILWWWPAQRPEYVYIDEEPKLAAFAAVTPPDQDSGIQVPWVGVDFDQLNPAYMQFALDIEMVEKWQLLGFIVFKKAGGGKKDRYVEVQRTLPRKTLDGG